MRSVFGLFTAENRGDRSIALRVPQGVGLNRRGPKSVVVDRREVCEHVRKSVYGPCPSYGHLLTERLTHALILESASHHSLKNEC